MKKQLKTSTRRAAKSASKETPTLAEFLVVKQDIQKLADIIAFAQSAIIGMALMLKIDEKDLTELTKKIYDERISK